MVQLSHPYMTSGKARALTRQTSVFQVMFLLFNVFSRLVMDFLCSSSGKESAWSAGDLGLIPGLKERLLFLKKNKKQNEQTIIKTH